MTNALVRLCKNRFSHDAAQSHNDQLCIPRTSGVGGAIELACISNRFQLQS